jgi:hypothetical protein
MQSQRIPISGIATTTTSSAAARKFVMPLPFDGSWAINGQIIATNPASGRQTCVYNVTASGNCVAGAVTETDGVGPSAWPTQPSPTPLAGALVTVVFNNGSAAAPPVAQINPTAEIELTGSSVGALDWSCELTVTLTTVP